MTAREHFGNEQLQELENKLGGLNWREHFDSNSLEMAMYVINRMEIHINKLFESGEMVPEISQEIEFLSKRAESILDEEGQNNDQRHILDALVYLGLEIAIAANGLLTEQIQKYGADYSRARNQ